MNKLLKKIKKVKMPQTHWGFPINGDCASDSAVEKEGLRREKQKGISLLIAIMTIAIMVSFVADLIVTSSVQLELAMASKDKIKAEYVAKSGGNLALFILTISHGIDLVKSSNQFKQEVYDGPESLWNFLNSIPVYGANSVLLGRSLSQQSSDEDGNPLEDNDPLGL